MNPKTIRKSLNLTQSQMAAALGLKLRQYQYIERGAGTSESVKLLLEFIASTKIIAQKFEAAPDRDSEGDPSAECRYCFGFIGVGDTCYIVVKEQEQSDYDKYNPYCSIKCAFASIQD